MPSREAQLYSALLELSHAIAGHHDPDSLCQGLARALRTVFDFDFLGVALHDPARSALRLYGLATHLPVPAGFDRWLPLEDNPAGWVWQNQQPLRIPELAQETRWPEFMAFLAAKGVRSVTIVPLTSGNRRLGILALGSVNGAGGLAGETDFLQRAASEFAVAVEAHLARQALIRERDRLEALFELTNTLVSKLSWEELLAAISAVLGKVLPHDGAAITLLDKATGALHLHALHVADNIWPEVDPEPTPAAELPSGRALAAGRPLVTTRAQFDVYPPAVRRTLQARGVEAICSIPLVTANGPLGTLELGRRSRDEFTPEQLEFAVQAARQIAIALENSLAFRELAEIKEKLALEKLYLEDEIRFEQNLGNMVGQGPAFQALLKSIQIVAPTDATVLIQGETGTGKELVARAIHEASPRRQRSFVKVNCAAIPSTLLESELFGHEKGAFTGALARKIGRFELADQGTLFLDEIGEIPLELQPKLLRAIQEQEFERLGGNRTLRVNVRLIAATNRDLKAMLEEGKFRSDLYYRLNVFPIQTPPLRERREDIPLLVRYFTQKYAQRAGRTIDSIPARSLEALARYDWPGNIRELQNLIERSVILSPGPVLQVALPEGGPPAGRPSLRHWEEAAERQRILRALKQTKGVVGGAHGAAALLGMKRTTLQSRMKKLGIRREYR